MVGYSAGAGVAELELVIYPLVTVTTAVPEHEYAS